MARVLIVDSKLSIRETFRTYLEQAGYETAVAADFFQAQTILDGHPCDIVLSDVALPHTSGLELLKQVHQINEDIPVILITDVPDISTAAEAMRCGAYDYVAKPMMTQKVLNRVVSRAAEKKRLLDEQRRLEAENWAYQTELEKKIATRTAELELRNQELGTLIEISRDVSATLNLTKILKRVSQHAAHVCGAHRCTVLMLSQDGKTITPLISQFRNGRADQEMWRRFLEVNHPMPVNQVPEAQQVIRDWHPLFISDISTSSLPRRWIEPFGVRSVLIVPLISKEHVIGLIGLDHIEEGQAFTAEQVDMAVTIGTQAAVAIENAQLLETERQQRELAETLQEVTGALNSSLDRAQVLQVILGQLARVIAYDGALVLLTTDVGLDVVAQQGLDLEGQRSISLHDDDWKHLQETLQQRRPLIIADASANERWQHLPGHPHIRCWLSVPLLAQDQAIGLLSLGKDQPNYYTERKAELMTAFANQAATAIENARLYAIERQRAAALAHALEQQRELDRLKDEFIQNVSHELRTPLGILHGYVELLDSGDLGKLAPDQSESMHVIKRRVRTLRNLVGNLTAIVETETQEPRREPVNLVELAQIQLVDFRIVAEQAGLTLKQEIAADLPPVSGNPFHLRRVLENLLGNAFKFTPGGGCITVRLEQKEADAVLEISDTGTGIPADQLERVFERFYQVDGSMSRRYGGTGLGLALVKEVVRAHSGQVSVQSVVGQGSTFRVTLPIAADTQE